MRKRDRIGGRSEREEALEGRTRGETRDREGESGRSRTRAMVTERRLWKRKGEDRLVRAHHSPFFFFSPSLLVGYVHTVGLLRTPCNHATRKKTRILLAFFQRIDQLKICRSEFFSEIWFTQIANGIRQDRCAHSKQVTRNWRGSHVYNAPTLLSSPLCVIRVRVHPHVCIYVFTRV